MRDDDEIFEVKPAAKLGTAQISKAHAEMFHDEAVEKAGDWLLSGDEVDDETREIMAMPDDTSKDDEREAISRGARRRRNDPSLTDKENALTEYERLFVIEYVRTEKAKASALAAGYSESCAASKASRLLKDPRIRECIEERRKRMSRLLGLDDDFVLSGYLEIYNRAMQNVPAMDRDGVPTGYYSYDGSTAIRALEMIAKVKGMDKEEVKEKEIEAQTAQMTEDISNIALRLRREADKNKEDRS